MPYALDLSKMKTRRYFYICIERAQMLVLILQAFSNAGRHFPYEKGNLSNRE